MLTNYHTHTTFCDGKNTPEEVVLSAIEQGMDAIGFSGHGYTGFDHTYCMKKTDLYIAEVNRLKQKYANKIQIYLGIEEDIYDPRERGVFDYIIGSSHYFLDNGVYYPIDSSPQKFEECLKVYGGDIIRMTHAYYKPFCDYIKKRKPDIVGHFDLLTKFDENENSKFLCNPEYKALAEMYLLDAIKSGSFFEMNTGAISRGYRTTPYPQENLLQILKKNDVGIVLSSDSHAADTLTFAFDDAKAILKDAGFEYTYVLYDGEFKKDYL